MCGSLQHSHFREEFSCSRLEVLQRGIALMLTSYIAQTLRRAPAVILVISASRDRRSELSFFPSVCFISSVSRILLVFLSYFRIFFDGGGRSPEKDFLHALSSGGSPDAATAFFGFADRLSQRDSTAGGQETRAAGAVQLHLHACPAVRCGYPRSSVNSLRGGRARRGAQAGTS